MGTVRPENKTAVVGAVSKRSHKASRRTEGLPTLVGNETLSSSSLEDTVPLGPWRMG